MWLIMNKNIIPNEMNSWHFLNVDRPPLRMYVECLTDEFSRVALLEYNFKTNKTYWLDKNKNIIEYSSVIKWKHVTPRSIMKDTHE